MSSKTGPGVTVEEPRPEYAWVFDLAIAAGFGLAVAAALINQHRIHKRLLELVESTKRTRADSMRELEATIGEPDRVAAGDDDE